MSCKNPRKDSSSTLLIIFLPFLVYWVPSWNVIISSFCTEGDPCHLTTLPRCLQHVNKSQFQLHLSSRPTSFAISLWKLPFPFNFACKLQFQWYALCASMHIEWIHSHSHSDSYWDSDSCLQEYVCGWVLFGISAHLFFFSFFSVFFLFKLLHFRPRDIFHIYIEHIYFLPEFFPSLPYFFQL